MTRCYCDGRIISTGQFKLKEKAYNKPAALVNSSAIIGAKSLSMDLIAQSQSQSLLAWYITNHANQAVYPDSYHPHRFTLPNNTAYADSTTVNNPTTCATPQRRDGLQASSTCHSNYERSYTAMSYRQTVRSPSR